MAIQLSRNNGTALRLAQANRPDKRNFAICGWAKLNTVVAQLTNLFAYFEVDVNLFVVSWVGFTTNADGSTMGWWSGGSKTNITTITAGRWFWWAVKSDSTTSKMWFWTHNGGLFTDSRSNTLSAGTTGYFDFGSHVYNEPWDGSICSVKVFTASITDAELQNEQWSMAPKAANKLHSWYPMLDTSLTNSIKDFSGNGKDLTAEGATQPTVAVETPPIPYASEII